MDKNQKYPEMSKFIDKSTVWQLKLLKLLAILKSSVDCIKLFQNIYCVNYLTYYMQQKISNQFLLNSFSQFFNGEFDFEKKSNFVRAIINKKINKQFDWNFIIELSQFQKKLK